MSTSTTELCNQVYHNVVNQSISVDVSNVDEIVFSISCDSNSTGLWSLSRIDAFGESYLFQQGSLTQGDQFLEIGPSSSYDVTNALGDTLKIDITDANGNVMIAVCVTGKAYM